MNDNHPYRDYQPSEKRPVSYIVDGLRFIPSESKELVSYEDGRMRYTLYVTKNINYFLVKRSYYSKSSTKFEFDSVIKVSMNDARSLYEERCKDFINNNIEEYEKNYEFYFDKIKDA